MVIFNNTAFSMIFTQTVASPCNQIDLVAFFVLCVLQSRTADAINVPQQDTVILQWLYF